MNITIDELFQNFTLVEEDFQVYAENFTKIEVEIKYNCCDSIIFEDTILPIEESSSSSTSSSSEVDTNVGEGEYSYMNSDYEIVIDKDIFTTFTTSYIPSGVYTITIKIYFDEDVLIYETFNCIFVDYDIDCQVVNFMANNLTTETGTEVGILYYALKNSTNCDCECDNICILYQTLYNYLNNTENINICGC